MRKLTPQFIGRYLAAAGEEVLSSVGAYQIEGSEFSCSRRSTATISPFSAFRCCRCSMRSGAKAAIEGVKEAIA